MSESLKKLLHETVADVYEKMFFTFLEEAEESGYSPDKGAAIFLEAEIGLTAGEKGAVRFYYPEALARHIATNFLGIDFEDLDDGKMHDTLGEAANMVVGSLLGRLDPDAVCGTLGIPSVVQPSVACMGDILDRPDIMAFHTDFGWLLMDYGVVKQCFHTEENTGK